jgi:hypothetical protein
VNLLFEFVAVRLEIHRFLLLVSNSLLIESSESILEILGMLVVSIECKSLKSSAALSSAEEALFELKGSDYK